MNKWFFGKFTDYHRNQSWVVLPSDYVLKERESFEVFWVADTKEEAEEFAQGMKEDDYDW